MSETFKIGVTRLAFNFSTLLAHKDYERQSCEDGNAHQRNQNAITATSTAGLFGFYRCQTRSLGLRGRFVCGINK
jgi:hypothetical protein